MRTSKTIERLKTAWLYATATVEYACMFLREAMHPTNPTVSDVRSLEDEALEADAAYLAAHGVKDPARTAAAFRRLARMSSTERSNFSQNFTKEPPPNG